MIARILFVCAKNVCRSPLMAASFAEGLGDGCDDWSLRSGGTHARAEQEPCPYAIETAPAVAVHRSTPVTRTDIESADLVIAASREERSWIAQRSPRSRARTFTLREALLLDAGILERPSFASLDEYVTTLNAHRGTLRIKSPIVLPWRRDPEHPLDVKDVHGSGDRQHRRGLAAASRDAIVLGQRLRILSEG